MNLKNLSSPVRLAILSLVLCGLIFPLLITGLAQLFFPNQANGDLVQLNGRTVGSAMIAQQFSSPMFFHPRPSQDSASGVDPDITADEAYSQTVTISKATNITVDALRDLVRQNIQRTLWIAGEEYVNVLILNIQLIQGYPSIYEIYQ